MDTLEKIDGFVSDIDECRNVDGVSVALKKHLERLGFCHFAYWLLSPEHGLTNVLFLSTLPRHLGKNYRSDDIIPAHLRQTLRPFLWNLHLHNPQFTQLQRTIFNHANDIGVKLGATVPIHGPRMAVAKLSAANFMKEREFNDFFLYTRHAVQLMAIYAHEKIVSLQKGKLQHESTRLSPREIEILTWTAHGKTRREISSILSISEDTVKNHLDHCCRKLNVCNKTHAVAVAVHHSLVKP